MHGQLKVQLHKCDLSKRWDGSQISSASYGRTTCQPVLTTFLQPRHIPTQGYNITQSSAPDDGHMVARNMLSNY